MIKWFKNRFHEEQEIVETENKASHHEMSTQQEETKTIIRDRRFRFPILPDDELDTQTNRREEPITINKGQRIFTNPYAYMEEKVEPEIEEQPIVEEKVTEEQVIEERIQIENQEEKQKTRKQREPRKVGTKPFQPTQVISPIYGYEKRPETLGESTCSNNFQVQQTELDAILRKNRSTFFPNEQHATSLTLEAEDIVEFELPSVPSFIKELGLKVEEEAQVDVQLPSINEVDKKEEPHRIEPKMVEHVQVEKEGCKVEIENNIQVHVHTVKEEVEQKEQVVTQVESKANEAKEEAVTVEEPKMEQPKREKKRHIPFNVMMLRRDREAAQRQQLHQVKKEQEEMKSPQIEEMSLKATDEKKVGHEAQISSENEQVVNEPGVVEEKIVEVQNEVLTNPEPVIEEKIEEKVEEKIEEESLPLPNEEKEEDQVAMHTPLPYAYPSLDYLEVPYHAQDQDNTWLEEQWQLLDTTLLNFNVGAKVIHVAQGPSVTRFEVQPEPGVKVNKITNLTDDIKLNLAAKDIRIEAPIPGKNAVGIEVPNKKSKPVFLREILESDVFLNSSSPLTIALGLDISGEPIVADIRKMPHGLIAGATGSGKSVCINSLLVSILYKAMPHEVKLLLIDPKMVELAPYNNIPHLVSPVITDAKAATAALKWAVEEMERRYELFAHAGARDLIRYNDLAQRHNQETLPYLVIVIDELADLMMVAPGDVEESICRIAQKARACGIHLIVATQRPSVDVITGLIKANIPTRVAFTVSSQVDSRTIIDVGGAEKLLGRGDMLFLNNGESKPIRLQGVYVSDDEIEQVVNHVKEQMAPNYLFQKEELLAKVAHTESEDELFLEACEYVVEQEGASASMLQRRFRIGYNRAARLIDLMESRGIISEAKGSKPREVLISQDDLVGMAEG